MTPDAFYTERHRIEQMLNLLERSTDRLLAGRPIALSELRQGVEFLRATEEAGYDEALKSDGSPVLAELSRGACCGPRAAGGHGEGTERIGRGRPSPRLLRLRSPPTTTSSSGANTLKPTIACCRRTTEDSPTTNSDAARFRATVTPHSPSGPSASSRALRPVL